MLWYSTVTGRILSPAPVAVSLWRWRDPPLTFVQGLQEALVRRLEAPVSALEGEGQHRAVVQEACTVTQ